MEQKNGNQPIKKKYGFWKVLGILMLIGFVLRLTGLVEDKPTTNEPKNDYEQYVETNIVPVCKCVRDIARSNGVTASIHCNWQNARESIAETQQKYRGIDFSGCNNIATVDTSDATPKEIKLCECLAKAAGKNIVCKGSDTWEKSHNLMKGVTPKTHAAMDKCVIESEKK